MGYKKSALQLSKEEIYKKLSSSEIDPKYFPKDAKYSQQDLARFELKITGKVVYPWSEGYEQDRQEFNPAFQGYPQMIVFCANYSDVKECLQYAKQFELWTVVRSGRHSLAGYSVCDGLVIDTSEFNDISIDAVSKTAIVGACVDFEKLNARLHDYHLNLPGGGCPTVCVAGYMQGGGFGFTSRAFGMNSDCVLEVKVMLADGNIVIANENTNFDLFWAIRGGTGGNFGVLLEVTYQLFDISDVVGVKIGFSFEEDCSNAAAALDYIQKNYQKDGVTKLLGTQTVITTDDTLGKSVLFCGLFIGIEKDLNPLIQPLLDMVGAVQLYKEAGAYKDINEAVLDGTPNLPEGVMALSQSGYIESPMVIEDWSTVLDFFKTCPNQYTMIDMEGYGGAINTYPVEGSAFIHRNNYCDFFCDVYFTEESERDDNKKWLAELMEFMKPYFNGHSYQNYPNREMEDYRWSYWGEYYNSLLFVKQKFDPNNFFTYEQSIKPYPTTNSSKELQQSMFSNLTIEYAKS